VKTTSRTGRKGAVTIMRASPAPPDPGSPAGQPPLATRPAETGPAPPSPLAALDRVLHGIQGKLTGGASPYALPMAFADWALHMANAPFRQMEIAGDAALRMSRLGAIAAGATVIEPAPNDHRFDDERWKDAPFNLWHQSFLLAAEWVERASGGLPGVAAANERMVNFAMRQWMDVFSPSNLPWANPEIIDRTIATSGANLVAGFRNFLDDLAGGSAQGDGSGLRVGRDLAATPGKVVFRTPLIELIQYAPSTETVRRPPVLVVPAWIMKYYILDLSPQNSLIRHLVGEGFTVFCISWRNPGAAMRDVGFDDYRLGLMAAVEAVTAITGQERLHAAGYCLGGTLLSIAAAAMARDRDERLASITLFATQTDFTDAGELQLFVTEDQLAFLEDVMAVQGYLDARQMSGAFQMLRSRDLIWSRLVREYWLGEREHPNDLMTWNADATRMPARMHSEYLRRFFLRDDFAEGRFTVDGQPVALSDIRQPFFVVGTETDHVAPWRSVYKLHLLNPAEITFVLTSGGHNAGIVSEPGHPHRHFRVGTRPAEGGYVGPDAWVAAAELREGSWWPAWIDWLGARSGPRDREPPPIGSAAYPATADAPGSYVMER
jgi:polyhydroxyalkanoate synthase